MKRRLISLLLTAMMIMAIVPTFNVFAASTTDTATIATKWRKNNKIITNDAEEVVGTTITEVVTGDNALSGNNAVHLKFVAADAESKSDTVAGTVALESDPLLDNSNKNLTLTFWAKGSLEGFCCNFFNWGEKLTDICTAVEGAKVGDWQKYTTGPRLDEGGSSRLVIAMSLPCASAEAYFDNFSLTYADTADSLYGTDLCSAIGGIGEAAEDPLAGGDDEKDDSYVPSVTPDTTGIEMDSNAWNENTTDAGFSQEGTVKDIRYSTKEAYEGNGSFHIQYDEPKDTDGALGLQIRNKTQLPTTKDATYTVSFYAKGTGLENVQTAYPRYDKISLTDTSWYETAATDKEGWTKYTYTRNIPGTSCDTFRIYVNDKADFYIDKLVITDQDGTTEYLNLDFNIEEVGGDEGGDDTGEEYVPSVTPDTTGIEMDATVWTENQSTYSQTGTEKDLRYSTQDYFAGNRSFHIQYDEPKDADGKLGLELRVKAPELPTTVETYTISFYAKGTGLENVGTLYPRYDRRVITDTTWYTATATDKDGWKKYTHTQNIVNAGPNTFRIQITAKADFYIDEIVITDSTGKEYLNLNFDYVQYKASIEKDLTLVPLMDVTDYKFQERPMGGNASTLMTNGELVYDYGYSSMDSHSGDKSLRIQLDSSSTSDADNVNFRTQLYSFNAGTDAIGKNFKLTFYAKGNTDNVVVTFFSNTAMKLSNWKNTNITDVTMCDVTDAGNGWKKYEAYGKKASQNDWFSIRFHGKADAFIDDITVYECDAYGVVAEGAEDLYGGKFTFDSNAATVAVQPVVYDETGAEINALTEEHSKKKLTAKAVVRNISDETYPETAQIFIVVTKGDLLVDMSSSDVKTVTKGGAAAVLETDITMPEFTNASEYKVTAYLWNSRDGLIPLTAPKEL